MTGSAPEQAEPRPPRGGWRRGLWRIVIGLSLAMNAVVIGIVAGALLAGGGRDHDGRPPLRAAGLAPLAALLPPDHRSELVGTLRDAGRAHGVSRERRASDRRMLAQLVAADPFDAEAVVGHLDRAQTRAAAFGRESNRVLSARLAAMTAAERDAYAARLLRYDRFRGGAPHRSPPTGRD